jgi:predicted permease
VLAAQAALALWAVAGAVLMLRTLENLQSLELGFEPEGLSLVALSHPYTPGRLPGDLADRLQAVVDRVEAHPAVQAATPVLAPPLVGGGGYDAVVQLEGQSREDMRSNPYLNWEIVLPGYFGTMDVSLVAGRELTARDGPGDPLVVVVNEATARALWPGVDAVGKRVGAFGSAEAQVWWTVVGVVADMRYRELLEPRPSIYFPFQQRPIVAPGQLIVRTSGLVDLLPVVSAALTEAAPDFRVVSASSLQRRIASPLARPRLSLVVLGALGMLVLLLSAVGVYGVIAASVRARVREMGVRLACGASPAAVAGLVLRQGVGMATVGVAAGLVASLATGRLLGALLFGVEPSDPVSLLGASALVLLVAAAATTAPALRAALTDPARALRED